MEIKQKVTYEAVCLGLDGMLVLADPSALGLLGMRILTAVEGETFPHERAEG